MIAGTFVTLKVLFFSDREVLLLNILHGLHLQALKFPLTIAFILGTFKHLT